MARETNLMTLVLVLVLVAFALVIVKGQGRGRGTRASSREEGQAMELVLALIVIARIYAHWLAHPPGVQRGEGHTVCHDGRGLPPSRERDWALPPEPVPRARRADRRLGGGRAGAGGGGPR